jgi:hypothetical protein
MQKIHKNEFLGVASLALIIVAMVSLAVPYSPWDKRFLISGRLSIVAFLFGIIILVWSLLRPNKIKGRMYAISTIVLFCIYVTFGLTIISRFVDHQGRRNLYRLESAMVQYAQNHEGCLPVADRWCDALLEDNHHLSKKSFSHFAMSGYQCNVAFNSNLSKRRLADVPGNVVLLFEADGGWNLNGSDKLLKKRERLGVWVSLVNGSLYEYDFTRDGIVWRDPNSASNGRLVPLRWKP